MKPTRRERKARRRRPAGEKVLRTWKQARPVLEEWRRKSATIRVRLRRPRVIDVVPIDFLRGEPVDASGEGTTRFTGRLIYFTSADVTIRRPSGAILTIDNYEIASLSYGRHRIEPA